MEKLLEYQKLDVELIKLEKEINKNEDRRKITSMVNIIKDSQAHIINLDKEAKNLYDEVEKLKRVEEKGISFVEKLSKNDTSKLDEKTLKEMQNKLSQTSKQLRELENRLIVMDNKIKSVLQDFEATKKKINAAKQKHVESKANFEDFYKTNEPKLLQLRKDLQKLENGIEPSKMQKYRTLKQDGTFPVLVPLVDKRCGGCRMELPSNELEKIKKSKKLECPSCRRIIYID